MHVVDTTRTNNNVRFRVSCLPVIVVHIYIYIFVRRCSRQYVTGKYRSRMYFTAKYRTAREPRDTRTRILREYNAIDPKPRTQLRRVVQTEYEAHGSGR